jgi:FkbH-like protein
MSSTDGATARKAARAVASAAYRLTKTGFDRVHGRFHNVFDTDSDGLGEGVDMSAADASAERYRSPIDVLGSQAAADFLWLWLRSDDSAYLDLYRALCLSRLTASPVSDSVDWSQHANVVRRAVNERYRLSPQDRDKLERTFADAHATLPARASALKEVRIVFLGDCLYEEVALFVAAECLKDGLLVRAEHVVSKNPLEQRRHLSSLDPRAYDAVFYSPFTYAFNPDYGLVLELSHAAATPRAVQTIVDQSLATAASTLDFLSERFEVPIVVHNASTLQRGTTLLKRSLKSAATSRTRKHARVHVNAWLSAYVEKRNRETFRHLFILDEAALAATSAERRKLGAYYYAESALHPTLFSRKLAGEVAEHIVALALRTKKLVIADLDNTLWEGIIGEGLGVAHHHDRQTLLKKLKDKGVILAIASKNDPAKVTWEGGTLDATCFVASEVSWDPKVLGIQRIFADLNIKPKDAVFIDDRPDERELVKGRWPVVHCADPLDPRAWRIFGRREAFLDDEQEFDRTAMYQQREKRDTALSAANVAEAAAQMFGRLALKATLTEPDKNGLRRVSELINRTNQWNLCASRTTFREVETWHASTDHTIYTVQLEDKFGSMGTTCVVVVHDTGKALEIPVFVLSCRVFGFGVETLMLDHLKRVSQKRYGAVHLRGSFKATEHNAPSKDMYRDHGFVADGEVWTYVGTPDERPVPAWFSLAGFDPAEIRRSGQRLRRPAHSTSAPLGAIRLFPLRPRLPRGSTTFIVVRARHPTFVVARPRQHQRSSCPVEACP